MSTISLPVRGKSWVFQVTALCIVLGALLAASLKTQRQAAKQGLPVRYPDVQAALRITRQDNIQLQQELAEYKDRYERLARQQARGSNDARALEKALAEAKMLAGTVPVRGPGVIITLRDSPKLDPNETRKDVIENYIVHDYDIRAVTNELFSMGAEAISVNDQRLIATSSIRCAGQPILVNSVQVAPPYTIKAIGKPDVLEKSLDLAGGPADGLFLLDMIEIKKVTNMVVPAYTGSARFNVAVPVQNTGGRR